MYTLDLPGFGLSDKPDLRYCGGLYAEPVHDFLEDDISQRTHGSGSGPGASYLVNMAVRRPVTVATFVLANPTGITSLKAAPVRDVTHGQLDSPIPGTSLYNSLVSMRGIERELREHIYTDGPSSCRR